MHDTVEISVDGGDHSIRVDADPNDTLLSGLLRAGVGIPYECSAGGCGSCKVKLTEGEFRPVIAETMGLRASDIRRNKYLACACAPVGNCSVSFRPDQSFAPVVAPTQFDAVLSNRRELTHDLTEFSFATTGAPTFLPGQYAKITLPNGTMSRNYSMSNVPQPDGVWQFIIRLVPGGELTPELFGLEPGADTFAIDGPYSIAHLDGSSTRAPICIAGGSGLAPMVSIIRGLQATPGVASTAQLFYGARCERDLFPLDLLADIPGFDPEGQVHRVLSDPAEDDAWVGPVGFIHQYLAEVLPVDCASNDFYVAGPPVMVDAVRRLLVLERNVPVDQVRYDRFF